MSYVGIVLVSHSEELVKGLWQLLQQVQPQVPIAIAGGTDEGELGTSPLKIQAAIQSVYSEKGVLILFDLGSARISTEMAIEWLEHQDRIKIANAPLVEGAYVATIQSGIGRNLDVVLASAEKARELDKLAQ